MFPSSGEKMFVPFDSCGFIAYHDSAQHCTNTQFEINNYRPNSIINPSWFPFLSGIAFHRQSVKGTPLRCLCQCNHRLLVISPTKKYAGVRRSCRPLSPRAVFRTQPNPPTSCTTTALSQMKCSRLKQTLDSNYTAAYGERKSAVLPCSSSSWHLYEITF
jgi:hypothetical protein